MAVLCVTACSCGIITLASLARERSTKWWSERLAWFTANMMRVSRFADNVTVYSSHSLWMAMPFGVNHCTVINVRNYISISSCTFHFSPSLLTKVNKVVVWISWATNSSIYSWNEVGQNIQGGDTPWKLLEKAACFWHFFPTNIYTPASFWAEDNRYSDLTYAIECVLQLAILSAGGSWNFFPVFG